MAELVSMYVFDERSVKTLLSESRAPTAGGQYHWTYLLAPREWRTFLSYVTGTHRSRCRRDNC